MPRQKIRTPEMEHEILSRMARGEPLAKICRDDHMPHMSTWRDWCREDENLNIAHGRARDDGYDALATQALDIADDGSNDTYIDDEGRRRVDSDVIQRSKLRVETRLKLLAKWDPRRYGDKVALVGGDENDAPISVIRRTIIDPNGDGA